MFKIMLVEDEAPLLRSMKRSIDQLNLKLEVIAMETNGIHALKKAKLLQPDIIITDICMPVMNGMQLIEFITKELPDIIPIIVSGYQEFQYAQQAIRLNVRDYLLKPIQEDQLNRLLLKVIHELNQKQLGQSHFQGEDEWIFPNDVNNKFIHQVADHIRKHYKNALTISDLAEQFSISHSQLTRQFKQYFGMTPSEYLIETRMDIAKKMMQTKPDLKVKDISVMIGYDDHHYFTRLFTKLTGMNPSEYRKVFL